MNIVYLLINHSTMNTPNEPFLYIGSKTSCKIIDGIIVDRHNRPYWSSSKYVKHSISSGDEWRLFDWVCVDDSETPTEIEAKYQIMVNAKDNPLYYNRSHANKTFNSALEGVGDAISKAKTGVVCDYMKDPVYYSRMHTKESIEKAAKSRTGNKKVIDAAKARNARLAECPKWVSARAKRVSEQFTGRKLTEREMYLRMHDDRYKPNRKLTNRDVWEIRFGMYSGMTLSELCIMYPHVSKPTLCRVKNMKVFKDIKSDWNVKTKHRGNLTSVAEIEVTDPTSTAFEQK